MLFILLIILKIASILAMLGAANNLAIHIARTSSSKLVFRVEANMKVEAVTL